MGLGGWSQAVLGGSMGIASLAIATRYETGGPAIATRAASATAAASDATAAAASAARVAAAIARRPMASASANAARRAATAAAKFCLAVRNDRYPTSFETSASSSISFDNRRFRKLVDFFHTPSSTCRGEAGGYSGGAW